MSDLKRLANALAGRGGPLRRMLLLTTSMLVGVGMWSGSELLALASSPSADPLAPPASSVCQPAKMQAAILGKKVGLTLGEAQRCWPNAIVSKDGVMTHPGDYIIPHGSGWIRAGYSIGAATVSGRTRSSRDALAYSCGQYIGYTLSSWEQWLTNVSFRTGNTAVYCYYAYNNWTSPSCSGFGQCLPPQVGVLGNYTWTVNPWYNQPVYYLSGNFSEFFYCRHYLNGSLGWNAWCD